MPLLLFDYPSSYVRLVLRIYFTVLLLALAFLGRRCCAQRVRLRLYRRRSVNIRQMTGWLNGSDAAFAFLSFRASPAGWLGGMMIVASLLAIICDLAVSGLVVTVNVVSRCSFNISEPYTALSTVKTSDFELVENDSRLFKQITQAQAVNQANGGIDGIFRKVNTDPRFRADERDIIGSWICEATGQNMSSPAGSTPANIISSLQNVDLLFKASNSSCWALHGDGTTSSLFIWSASTYDYSRQPWEVRAAVDMIIPSQDEKIMSIYPCQMNTSDSDWTDWALKVTLPEVALSAWCYDVQGDLYSHGRLANTFDLQGNISAIIASGLNSIIMNSCAAWNGDGSPLVIQDPTQGCLAARALVSWPVFFLFIIVTISTVAMLIYWTALMIIIRGARAGSSTEYIESVEECTPDGLLGWMRQATREEAVLKWQKGSRFWRTQWRYGPIIGQEATGLARAREDTEQSELINIQTRVERKPVPKVMYTSI